MSDDVVHDPELNQNLANLYNDPDTGLRSARRLWTQIRKKVPAPGTVSGFKYEPTYKYIQSWIHNQAAHSTHATNQVKHYFPITNNRHAPWERMQMDIMFPGNPNDKPVVGNDKESTCILVIIDTVTRYLLAYPMKSKSQEDVLTAFEQFLQDTDKLGQFPPMEMDVDKEASFQPLAAWCKRNQYDIDFQENTLGSEQDKDTLKLAFVDRAIRTLRTLIDKYQIQYDTTDWIHGLPSLIKGYNDTPHEATGESPSAMLKASSDEGNEWEDGTRTDTKRAAKLHEKAEAEPWNQRDIRIGSLVRVPEPPRAFYKQSKQKWQTVPTKVTDVVNGIYYKVRTSGKDHLYKKYQILPVRLSMHSNIYDTDLYPEGGAQGGQRRESEQQQMEANRNAVAKTAKAKAKAAEVEAKAKAKAEKEKAKNAKRAEQVQREAERENKRQAKASK